MKKLCANKIVLSVLLVAVTMPATTTFLTGCSTTKNLPEEEVLYTGIQEIAYNRPLKKKKTKHHNDSTGVITSIADAYKAVDELFQQKELSMLKKDSQGGDEEKFTKAQKDSIKAVQKAEEEAYETAKTEVEAALAYAPNNALFGSSSMRVPLPLGLWIYNATVGKKNAFAKWSFNNFAANPVYISSVNPRTRALVAQNTLRNYGYFNGTVDYEVLPETNPRKAKVGYVVMPRHLFRLDSIEYRDFPLGLDSLLRRDLHKSVLHKGDAFSVINLDAERSRLYEKFRNNGYFYYTPEMVSYQADTIRRKGFVQLRVKPASDTPPQALKQYYLGRTYVSLYGNEDNTLTDTLSRRDFTVYYKGKSRKEGQRAQMPLRLSALRRNLLYREGMLYRQDLMNFVAQQISEMDVFGASNLRFIPRDSTGVSDTLDVAIMAMLDKPYDGEFTTKLTSKSNGQVGPGVSFSMAKRNAFRGAEKLKFEVYGSYEWQTNQNVQGRSSVINSYEYGTSLSLDYPRLIMPGWQRLSRRARTSTSFALDASWLNRANYFSMVSLSAKVAYSYQPRVTMKHEFTPFRLEYDDLLSTTTAFDSIMNANQALYVSMRNQFVPSMRYAFTYSSRRNARNPRSLLFEVKESGNLVSGIYALCGKSFYDKDKQLFGVPFAQFVKMSAEFREEFKLTPRTSLATRVGMGVVFSYGNSTTAPYNDLFSVGGANSVRAFTVRGVGPGNYTPGATAYSYIDQMGDFKIELNAEFRFPIVSMLKGAVFLDAGNVWLLNSDANRPGGTFRLNRLADDIALGTGAGLRFDLDFLVLRFDVGVGIHAPYETGKSGYYNMPRFLDSLGYHLAVGYPF